MKKIFAGIGILVGLFSIFFFLLFADKIVYHSSETIYNFELSKQISGQELKVLAENTNTTVRLVDYKNTSFGEKELYITFIHPDTSIRFGKQPSVFPKNNIVYRLYDDKTQKNIQYFTIQCDDNKKIENVRSMLEEIGYDADVNWEQPITFHISTLFSGLNIGFFSLLTILLILSIATYYIYRLKEIGVLKLNGWGDRKISFRLLFDLLLYLYTFSLICVIPFGMYVITKDVAKIFLYVKVYVCLCLFLLAVFLVSAFVGTFFIHHVNLVGAIKNKKNNKSIFLILLLFKVITTYFLIASMNNSLETIEKLNATIQAIDKMENYDFHMIRTSVTPEESIFNKLNLLVDRLEDSDVFNYFAEGSIDKLKLDSYQADGKIREIEDAAYTDISANMLNYMDILDAKGNPIEVSGVDADKDTLLVPEHYKDDIEEILDYYQLGKETEILYIKNNQAEEDILLPGFYVYDSVYHIHPLQKTLYINSGEVLLNKESAEKMEKALKDMGIDEDSATVESSQMDYNVLRGNTQLTLAESLFQAIINSMSFLLCAVSISTIFLELRKKELGVYKLAGRYPAAAILKFVGLNAAITLLAAFTVNLTFLLLLLIEGAIYGIMISSYMKSKAVLALKGE